MIIAGIDEAGYGPLLGPLVVSCTAVAIPDAPAADTPATPMPEDMPCLWTLLKSAVIKKNSAKSKGRLLIADSKVVHNLTGGDRFLERGVLAFLYASDHPTITLNSSTPLSLQHCLAGLDCGDHGLGENPWYSPEATPLPHWAEASDLAISTNMLRNALQKSGSKIAAMRTIVVPEQRFNALVSGTNNKASALVSLTLQHLYFLHTRFGHLGLVVGIDKQGGRDHYTQLLLQSFPDASLKVLKEDGSGSSYVLTEISGPHHRRTVIHFREKGETHFLPTALASMICKYLRELCMQNFNHWWCQRIPALKPTAGYYLDGTRWLNDIDAHLPQLQVTREALIRIR